MDGTSFSYFRKILNKLSPIDLIKANTDTLMGGATQLNNTVSQLNASLGNMQNELASLRDSVSTPKEIPLQQYRESTVRITGDTGTTTQDVVLQGSGYLYLIFLNIRDKLSIELYVDGEKSLTIKAEKTPTSSASNGARYIIAHKSLIHMIHGSLDADEHVVLPWGYTNGKTIFDSVERISLSDIMSFPSATFNYRFQGEKGGLGVLPAPIRYESNIQIKMTEDNPKNTLGNIKFVYTLDEF